MSSNDAAAIFARADAAVWLVTVHVNGRRNGLIATFVNQASIVPECPRVAVGIARQHCTWTLIEQSRCFALQLLDEAHLDLVWRFGLQSGHTTDKLAGIDFTETPLGNPRLPGLAWLDCHVEASLPTGDRSIYLAAITAAGMEKSVTPLTAQRLIQLAPPERLQQLKRLMQRDQAIDAAAIRQWRATHPENAP